MLTKVIYNSPYLKVIFQDFGTELVVITFNELGSTINGDTFWGQKFFAKIGISSIGVMTPEPSWYPAVDMIKAVQSINAVTRSLQIVTYGHSQGGYGALKYSAALNANAVLSFCPQWSIAPDEVDGFDPRFKAYFKPGLDGGRSIRETDVSPNSFIFFDPLEKYDLLNANRLLQISSIRAVLLPFSGHDSIRLMSETDAARQIFSSLRLSSFLDINLIKRIFRQNRRFSTTYLKNRMLFLFERLPRTEPILRKYVSLTPSQLSLMNLIIELHKRNSEEVDFYMSSITDQEMINLGLIRLWTLFRKADYLDGEMRISTIVSSRFMGNIFFRMHRLDTLIRANMLDLARQELISIIAKFGLQNYPARIRLFAEALTCSESMKIEL